MSPALTLVAVVLLSNAPPPANPAAARDRLDALWKDLEKAEPDASRALLGLTARPADTVAFLRDKLKPLTLTPEAARKLIADLASDKEAVWKKAYAEMQYLDPRLAIGLTDLMDQVTETPTRQRLVAVLSGFRSYDQAEYLKNQSIELRPVDSGFNFAAKGSWWAEHRVDRLNVGVVPSCSITKWTQAVRAVSLLEHFGTPDAVAILKDMATGHADAQPTKVAKETLARLSGNGR